MQARVVFKAVSINAAWRACLLAMVVICMALMPGVAHAQTLERIRERGFLVCASVSPIAGFAQQDGEGRWTGFDIDICRAIAAAALGDPNLIEYRPLRGNARYALLQTGDIDVVVRNAPWTFQRDVDYGASYVTPIFYDGQAFMVAQDLAIVSAYELDGNSICISDDPELLGRLREFFFLNQTEYEEVLYEDLADLAVAYRAGLCEVVSASGRDLHALRRDLPDPGAHRILPERISKEALAPVVASGDAQWFDIVRWTIFSLVNAEELGVTALNLDQLTGTRTVAVRRLLGLELDFGAPLGLESDFMADVIRSVGNYGEIYERNFGPQTGAVLLRGQNSLWINGGQLYAQPVR